MNIPSNNFNVAFNPRTESADPWIDYTEYPQENNPEIIKHCAARYSNKHTSSNYLLDQLLEGRANNSGNVEGDNPNGDLILEDSQASSELSSDNLNQRFNPFDLNSFKSKKQTSTNSGFNLLRTYKPGEFLKSTIQAEQYDELSDSGPRFLDLTLSNRQP